MKNKGDLISNTSTLESTASSTLPEHHAVANINKQKQKTQAKADCDCGVVEYFKRSQKSIF